VKTTLDLPEELLRTVKIRAVHEQRRLKEVVADLLRRGLAASEGAPASRAGRVELPLVACAHPASREQEVTPERAAELLLAEETERAVADRVPVR